ncbi:MAG: hypothetical protein KDB04_07840 [Acidimicrobiales bacterium]|nr:hypothetical protein [Acidimicrobiales bacterium]
MTERRYRRVLAAATVVGLGLRLAWVAWASRAPTGPNAFFLDPARYLGYGDQIARGHGMVEGLTGDPTAYYPPGYPWFVGIVDWASSPITDAAWLAVAYVQVVLGTASIVLCAHVARRLAGPVAGVVAAAVFGIYPNLIFHTGVVLGETLYNFLFLAFLATLLHRPWTVAFTTRRALACGLLLGLAIMVRPISLAVIPVVIGCWVLARKDHAVVLRWSAALLVGVVACIAPWTIRNAVRLHAFVPISTNTGDNLCIGHADGATGAFQTLEACQTDHEFLDGLPAELASDKEKQRIAVRGFIDNLDREPWLLWSRTYYTWIRDGDHDALFAVQLYRQDRWMAIPTESRLIRLADAIYWLVVAAGLVGCVQLVRSRRPEALALVGCALMTALVPLAFFGDQRFKVPVIPMLIIAGATLLHRPDPLPPPERATPTPTSNSTPTQTS